MLRIWVRQSDDVRYLTTDPARELEGVRQGPAGWWWRGDGEAHDEREAAAVLRTSSRSAVVGYDLIFAAPRPMSILVAMDETAGPGVVAAHRSAVDVSLRYLEDRALVVRDRRHGDDRDRPGRWSSVVAYTHGVNRHGEPHVHDHVLVGARVTDDDRVLDARGLFAHAVTADALYRAHLRAEVAARTSWRPWRSFNGHEHVEHLDEGYRALWGGHFEERGDKHHWERSEVLRAWRRDVDRFEREGVVAAPAPRSTLDEHCFAATLEGLSSVPRRDVVRAWCNAAVDGVHADVVQHAVDSLYPELERGRGVRESSIGLPSARMIGAVRRHGPRPLERTALERWTQRSRDRDDWSRGR